MISDATKNCELVDGVLHAKRGTWVRLANIPGCIALGASDIGRCCLEDGRQVFITWGRNLKMEDQKWFMKHTSFELVHLGSWRGCAEVILPDAIALSLLDATATMS